MMLARSALVLLGMAALAQARPNPRVLEFFGHAASGGADFVGDFAGGVAMAGQGATNLFSEAFQTFGTVKDGFRGLVRDAWDSGAQTASRFSSAVRNTARDTARGFSDAAGAVNTYFADNIRAGGRLVSGAVGTGFGVVRGAVSAKGNLLHDIRGTVKGGFEDAADAVSDFAGDVIDSHVNLLGAATGVAEDVVTRGIENFAHVLAPSRF
ncbi:uncharacterized protein [Macrobrachium rosenbergii]|uniref:uncharacterized protein n=1 Tax=Macrobrachium rosenbergii TaxID=79674 RepID=UPI0034D7A790